MPLGRRILFLDFAGSGIRPSPSHGTHVASVITRGARAEQISVLSAALPNQMPMESQELQGGLFARALIEGLSGQAASKESGEISILDLGEYVSNRVLLLSGGRQNPPLFFTDEANAILGSRTKVAP
jgi:uncharacterized caspase-like protein